MTPAEWDACGRRGDPEPMLWYAWTRVLRRDRRRFAVAVYAAAGYPPGGPRERHLLRVAEKAAGGYIGENHLKREAADALRWMIRRRDGDTPDFAQARALAYLVDPDLRPNWGALRVHDPPGRPAEAWARTVVDLIRCVFGDPTRPVRFAAEWKTATALALARGVDADRAFDRLPILADALQDAGCESDAVLGHCRDDERHARGCWVVDGVLGRR